jgi:hypothetical protein
MAANMVKHIKLPRGTTAKVNQCKGKAGEISIDMEQKTLRIISLMAQQVRPAKVMSI